MATRKKKAAKAETTHVDPSKLQADFDSYEGLAVMEEHPFWMGLTADCPINQIDVGGLHFPKMEEEIVINNAGKQVRVPVVGALNYHVTRENFDALIEVLPRIVIRFTEPEIEEDENAMGPDGQNTGQPRRVRRGYLVKIPTKEQIEANEKDIRDNGGRGRRLRRYVRQPSDRPASEFMFFQHVADKRRGHNYQTIAEEGLNWPEVLEEIDALLS